MSIQMLTMKRRAGGLTVTPSNANGSHTNVPASGGPATRVITSNSVTASGGSSYSWAFLSGDNTITAGAPSAASTQFSATVAVDGLKTAVFRVTSGGLTADVNVNLSYNSGL